MANLGLTWTKERIERLTKLWTEGLSASQIATELGEDVSRNAVLGKAHRLGLAQNERKGGSTPRPRTPTCPPEPPTTEPPSRQDPDPVPGPASEPPTRQPQVTAAPAEVVPLRSEGVTIMELREAMCRWPLGDPTTPRSGSAERVRMSACRTARITRRSPTNRKRREGERI